MGTTTLDQALDAIYAGSETVFDGLGTETAQEIKVDTLKWRFFSLGLHSGANIQMFITCLLIILSANEAIEELSELYYPLFRGSFLLSLFGVLFGLLLFAWKRAGIDYAVILDVDPSRTNYHAVVRFASTLMFINFVSFVTFWLTLTVNLTPSKHLWPLIAFIGTFTMLLSPFDWISEWRDASQRAALVRTAGRALCAPIASSSFAASFVADVFTSMPKCFIDLLYSSCIYATGEAFATGDWHEQRHEFDRDLSFCTVSDPIYRSAFRLLSILPFYIRLMQCLRQIWDAARAGSENWRQPLANSCKYTASILVQVVSMARGDSEIAQELWFGTSIFSTLFAFSWDVLVDWGLGPQPLRRLVRRKLSPSAPHGQEFSGASYWLRPVRVFSPIWYAAAILIDFVARLSWAVYISPDQRVVAQNATLLLGTVELLRRAVWALFRVEWEQILRMAQSEHEKSEHRKQELNKLELGQHPLRLSMRGTSDILQHLQDPLLAVGGQVEEDAAPGGAPPSKEERIQSMLKGNAKRMKSGVFETPLLS